jgi:hypothetical protein
MHSYSPVGVGRQGAEVDGVVQVVLGERAHRGRVPVAASPEEPARLRAVDPVEMGRPREVEPREAALDGLQPASLPEPRQHVP